MIDLHTHILPREWPDLDAKYGYGGFVRLDHYKPCCARMMVGERLFREISDNVWEPARRIEEMDGKGVSMQVLSTVPVMFSYWAKPTDALDLSRRLNDHIAEVVRNHPTHFTGLGTIPIQDPDLAAGVRAIAADPGRLDEVWGGLTRIAIDHAVAEPAAEAGHVVVVPAPFRWDDVGDFASLATLLPADAEPRVLGESGDVTAVDTSGVVVARTGRRVAVVGLDDVVVVDTPDALLVTTKERVQDVKRVVDELTDRGLTELT